ncbi:flagellar FlbD family protein [Fuchsiella alkaliacetigena]|nr:flagellar FlbD family protein [Fuchsiella alkaliacetigena]MCK8823545.1 flagellar FlbD family protein [Fuchsiella alkaliacetigena]
MSALIEVTKLNGTPLVINAELIELVETTPDTVVSLTSGRKIVVQEDAASIVERVVDYKQEINKTLEVIKS